jgi:hypothetical protein
MPKEMLPVEAGGDDETCANQYDITPEQLEGSGSPNNFDIFVVTILGV